jgi:hypothetical protein
MRLSLKTSLKEKIFSELNQIEIFSRYTTIDAGDITNCLHNSNKKTNNPLRLDNNASVGFKWTLDNRSGDYKVKMYDFADSYWRGDVIDIVGKILHLNAMNNLEFIAICEHIIDHVDSNYPIGYTINTPVKVEAPGVTEFGIRVRDFNKRDTDYWAKCGLDINDLLLGRVFAVEQYWILPSTTLCYRYSYTDPCYAYLLDNIGGILIWKLYFINRGKNGDKRARFITNNTYPLEAMNELKESMVLVITKSRGDTLVMRKLIDKQGQHASLSSTGEGEITVTNLTSEAIRLSKELVAGLRKNHEYIYLNTDFDPEGIRCAKYHLRKFGIQPLFLTNGKGGTKNYGAKDIKDYVVKFGVARSVTLIGKIITKLIKELEEVSRMKF